jgi:ribonucleoside-diphosphate reductase alpha chain
VADAALGVWSDAIMDSEDGYRNSQVTVLAPTGTIGFMMDCDTTGIEPMLGLVTWKKLVGGGYMTLVNQAVPRALARLGYEQAQIDSIVAHIDEHGTIEGADIGDRDLPVFDSALTPAKGKRSINWKGHIEMMAAVQPFLSGAISKTVNLPSESTIEDIAKAYVYSWKTGLKAVAIYRDGSKAAQPMSVKREETKEASAVAVVTETPDPNAPPRAARHRLPDERASLTHKFNFAGHEGYITVGLYPNGQPGEIFIRMAKEGSTISGLRAVRLDRQRSPGLCQVGHGLHRPLAPASLSRRRAARHLHVGCSSQRCCGTGGGQRVIPCHRGRAHHHRSAKCR